MHQRKACFDSSGEISGLVCKVIRQRYFGATVKAGYRGWLLVALLSPLLFISSIIFPPTKFRLEVEAEISEGETFQIFFNDDANLS